MATPIITHCPESHHLFASYQTDGGVWIHTCADPKCAAHGITLSDEGWQHYISDPAFRSVMLASVTAVSAWTSRLPSNLKLHYAVLKLVANGETTYRLSEYAFEQEIRQDVKDATREGYAVSVIAQNLSRDQAEHMMGCAA